MPLILTYHAISTAKSPVCIAPDVFESHLAALAQSGWVSVSLSEVLDWLEFGTLQSADVIHPGDRHDCGPSSKAVAITFDDGYASVYHQAWPRLKAWGFGATLFVITGRCGRDNRWPGQPGSMPTLPLLDWDQLGELGSDGFEFGAHTHTHPPLTEIPLGQAEDEIARSKEILAARTGQPVPVFAPPYGATNKPVQDLISQYFCGSATTELGVVRMGADPCRLKRLDAFYFTQGRLPWLEHPLFDNYLKIRQILRTLKRRVRPDWER
ncbi:MAG: polysaccharide deacetylase family protein [Anaerolineales bacterium]